jgi:chitodextrinase
MNKRNLLLGTVLLLSIGLQAQNLYTAQNAASPNNEVNGTTGLTGTANITSVTTNPQNGNWAIRIVSNGNNRDARATFQATVGTVYEISIWARRGTPSNNPAFANWTGFQGFQTRVINGNTWAQYNFTLTATNANPVMIVYAAPIGASSGQEVFIDNIMIVAQGGGGNDTQPPSAPSNLSASNTTSNSTTLTWNSSNDNVGVTQYQIRQNNQTTGTVGGNTTTYNAAGLTPSTTYSFSIVAVDAAGNISQPSNTIQVTTSAGGGGDNQPPSAPSNLSASNTTSNSTTLNWNASNDNVGVTQYQIRRNDQNIGNVSGNTTTYNATGLNASTNYSFNVVALDAAGNISQPSNTVQITTTSGGGNAVPYTSLNANLPSIDWQARNIYSSGVVGIGTAPNNNFQLSVNGDIRAKEVIVESGWSDFVFDDDYYLATLDEVEQFILENGHLKDIPPAKEIQLNGIGLAEINTLLLQKIEELTLYMIDLNKKIKHLESDISSEK